MTAIWMVSIMLKTQITKENEPNDYYLMIELQTIIIITFICSDISRFRQSIFVKKFTLYQQWCNVVYSDGTAMYA